eukprot:IDg17423t1
MSPISASHVSDIKDDVMLVYKCHSSRVIFKRAFTNPHAITVRMPKRKARRWPPGPHSMDLDAVLTRYFSNEHVASWLLAAEPVRQVSADALRRAFVYSISFGAQALGDGPHSLNVEDMLIVCSTPDNFVLGCIWGLGQPHVFSLTPLMRDAVPLSRRFAVDLSQSTCLEFLEIVRFSDNKTVVFLRHFLHTPDYTLPVVAAAHLYGPPEPGLPLGRLLMKATIRETANCPNCCRAADKCVSFALAAVVPQVGDVELFTSYVPARTLLQFGDSPYMRRMQRRAVHELGVSIQMPRLDERVQSIAIANDWTRKHEAYLVRKRPRELEVPESVVALDATYAVAETLVRTSASLPTLSSRAYDVPPEALSVLPDFFVDSYPRRQHDDSPKIYIPSPLLGPDEEQALAGAVVVPPTCTAQSNT